MKKAKWIAKAKLEEQGMGIVNSLADIVAQLGIVNDTSEIQRAVDDAISDYNQSQDSGMSMWGDHSIPSSESETQKKNEKITHDDLGDLYTETYTEDQIEAARQTGGSYSAKDMIAANKMEDKAHPDPESFPYAKDEYIPLAGEETDPDDPEQMIDYRSNKAEAEASEFDYEDYKTNLKTCPNCGSKKINIDAPWSTAESYKCRDCGNTWSTMNAFDDPTGTAFEDWDEAGYQAKYGGRKLDSHGQPNNDFEPQAGKLWKLWTPIR